jgi:polar amino acid transport system substrate-binding protein
MIVKSTAIACASGLVCWAALLFADANTVAPTGTLRAVYLAGNPAQAVQDPKTGEIRGISADLAREFGRRFNVPVQMTPLPGVQAVIEAVSAGTADIGFLANDPSRRGTIEFSQTYLRNPQSLVVPAASNIQSFADLDRAGLRIGATKGDSIALFLARTLKVARLVEMPGGEPADVRQAFEAKSIDAFGASRQRLARVVTDVPALRTLPGSIFGVPQAIIVPARLPERLTAVNAFLDATRNDGFLQRAIDRANVGVEIEPALGR